MKLKKVRVGFLCKTYTIELHCQRQLEKVIGRFFYLFIYVGCALESCTSLQVLHSGWNNAISACSAKLTVLRTETSKWAKLVLILDWNIYRGLFGLFSITKLNSNCKKLGDLTKLIQLSSLPIWVTCWTHIKLESTWVDLSHQQNHDLGESYTELHRLTNMLSGEKVMHLRFEQTTCSS